MGLRKCQLLANILEAFATEGVSTRTFLLCHGQSKLIVYLKREGTSPWTYFDLS